GARVAAPCHARLARAGRVLEGAVHGAGEVQGRRERAAVEADLPVPRQEAGRARLAVAADCGMERRHEPLDLLDGRTAADRPADADDDLRLLEAERRRVRAPLEQAEAAGRKTVEVEPPHLRLDVAG